MNAIRKFFSKLLSPLSNVERALYLSWVLLNMILLLIANPLEFKYPIWPFESYLNNSYIEVTVPNEFGNVFCDNKIDSYAFLNPLISYDLSEFLIYTILPFIVILVTKRFWNNKLKYIYLLWVILHASLYFFAVATSYGYDYRAELDELEGEFVSPTGINFYPFSVRRVATIKNVGELFKDERSVAGLHLAKEQADYIKEFPDEYLYVPGVMMGMWDDEFKHGWKPVYSWPLDPRYIYDLVTLLVYVIFPLISWKIFRKI